MRFSTLRAYNHNFTTSNTESKLEWANEAITCSN